MENKYDKWISTIPNFKSNKHYRVGDILLRKGIRWEQDRKTILESAEFKGSILERYLKIPYLEKDERIRSFLKRYLRRFGYSGFNQNMLLNILSEYAKENNIKPAGDDELVIQLRTGDAIAPSENDNVFGQEYMIFNYDTVELKINKLFKKPPSKVNVVTAMHFGDNEMNNMYRYSEKKVDRNRELIQKFFDRLKQKFPDSQISLYSDETLSPINCIDRDLCYLVLSKNLITDIGGFSAIVKKLQKKASRLR